MFKDQIVSFLYLKIFIIIVVLILIGSIAYKISTEITGASFRNNSFSLLILSKDSKLIYVDKSSKSATFLALGDIERFVKGKSPLEASFALGIPINAILVDKLPPKNLAEFTDSGNELRLFFGSNVTYKKLNRFDIYKVMSAVRSAHEDNRVELRLNLFDQDEVKEKLGELLTDSSIRNSDITIQIENGTTINGLGGILAIILQREGYNVIAVRTARPEISSYIAYEGKKNSYVDSLVGLTGFDLKNEKRSPAADVTIFIGDDVDAMLSP